MRKFRSRHPFIWALISMPWWAHCLAAAVLFGTFGLAIPAVSEEWPIFSFLSSRISEPLVPYISIGFLCLAAADLIRMFVRLVMLDRQTGVDSIKRLSWQQFEVLVAESFRLAGYTVRETGGGGPDGGIDLVLWKDGKMSTVQCKQWRSTNVGLSVVQEMYGVAIAHGASECFVVTSGGFSDDALLFAHGKNISLIDGEALVSLVKEANIQRLKIQAVILEELPCCKIHKTPMVWRLAQRGEHAGWYFWGCREWHRLKCGEVIDERDWAKYLQAKAEDPNNWIVQRV